MQRMESSQINGLIDRDDLEKRAQHVELYANNNFSADNCQDAWTPNSTFHLSEYRNAIMNFFFFFSLNLLLNIISEKNKQGTAQLK